MSTPIPANGLSPLDQIRQAEAEITKKIVTAREASESAIAEARLYANLLKKQAHESGIKAGRIRHKEILAQAEDEARGTVAHAQNQADELRSKGQARMEQAIRAALGIVLGVKGGGRSDES
jgi:vacuolar-type H+-ATPase subunit H